MPHRKIELVRAAWGLAGIAAPRTLLRVAGGDPRDHASQVVTRILGARQLTQAVLSGVSPTPAVLALGVWVDTIHSGTAVGLATLDSTYTRPALVDAVIAGGWARLGYNDLGGDSWSDGEQLRTRLARIVLSLLPGGGRLLTKADRAH